MLEEAKDRLRLSNGAVILSLPASARAGRGWTASMVIFDELAHYIDSLGNPGADAVFDAFEPTVATFGDAARLIITTTPSARVGIVYDLFERSQAGELDDFFVTQAPTRQLNPNVSEKTISRARQRDAESASVEYDAEFREPIEAFLSGEAIDRAIDPQRPMAERGAAGCSYAMAVDPAVVQDRYAFMLGHRAKAVDPAVRGPDSLVSIIIVDYCALMVPPIDPAAAEALLADLVRRFRPFIIRTDSAALVQRLQGQLPALVYEPFTRPKKLQWYGGLKEALGFGTLSLPDYPDLIDELKALQIRRGVDIGHPHSAPLQHDDLADCLALCVDALAPIAVEPAGEIAYAPVYHIGAGSPY